MESVILNLILGERLLFCGTWSRCAIFTRMQFQPTVDGILDLKFKKLTVSTSIDSQKTAQGQRKYTWSSSGYIWMRKPEPDGLIKLESAAGGEPSTMVPPSESAATTTSTTVPGTDLESQPAPLPTESPDSSYPSNLSTIVGCSLIIILASIALNV